MTFNVHSAQFDVAPTRNLIIKVDDRELKEVYHFKYLGRVLTRDGYCTREIRRRISMTK